MTQALAEKEMDIGDAPPLAAAGFVLPGVESDGGTESPVVDPLLSEQERQRLEDEKKKKKKRESEFLALLAAYYGVKPGHFDTLAAADGAQITPFLEAFKAVNQPQSLKEALVAQNMLGAQLPLDIRRDSITVHSGAALTMQMAIDMALAAKANPAFANGVDVTGNAAECAMLAAAAELVGLKVLNTKKVKPELLQQYRPQAAKEWAALKDLVAKRDRIENEDVDVDASGNPDNTKAESGNPGASEKMADADKLPAAPVAAVAPLVADALNNAASGEAGKDAKPLDPVESKPELGEEPLDFSSLPAEQQQKVKDFFRQENRTVPSVTDGEIARRWNEWPVSVRQRAFARDFNRDINNQARVKPSAQEAAAAATDDPARNSVVESEMDISGEQASRAASEVAGRAPDVQVVQPDTVSAAEVVPMAAEVEITPAARMPSAEQTQSVQVINNIVLPLTEKAENGDFGRDAVPITKAFAQVTQPVLLLEYKNTEHEKTAAQILEEGGVDPDLYALVRFRVIRDNDTRVKHVENIIGFDNNTEGSTKKARVILKALESDGVVVQERPYGPRRVVYPEGGLLNAGSDKPGPG